MYSRNLMVRGLSLLQSLASLFFLCNIALADANIPKFWDTKEQLATPQLDRFGRLAFLTTVDFPPLNFIDDTGRLTGFHVDLAKSICQQLMVTERCSIQALPWDELEPNLLSGGADVILAGIRASPERRKRMTFGRPYLQFPARFVVAEETEFGNALIDSISNRKIGVLTGSAHEAMLRDYFPTAKPVTFDRIEWLQSSLRVGNLDAIFGDGMQLAFWLSSTGSDNCCRFVGGPYLSEKYLGSGLSAVTSPENKSLGDALNYALRELTSNGTFAELYLRYFPISFY